MQDMQKDRTYMQRCIDLASKGLGSTAPNPMVGCVIVNNGKIIGEGYHMVFGEAHAEVNAIASVKDPSLLRHASLYVNLEPCSHYGRTPPCSSLIIDRGIPEVIIGSRDPHELVAGKGIRDLEEKGTRVRCGVMEEECRELNRRYITFHEQKRPYVLLKWAQTRDGFIDQKRPPGKLRYINWITDEHARQWVHKWRSEEQAILVGTNTAVLDDPCLTVRDWSGENPLRLVLDLHDRLPEGLHLFDGTTPTIVFAAKKKTRRKNLEYVEIPPGREELFFILEYLHSIHVQSLIVEGGARLLNGFIEKGIWDEARVFTGRMDFIDGVKAPVLSQSPQREILLSSGMLCVYRKNDPRSR